MINNNDYSKLYNRVAELEDRLDELSNHFSIINNINASQYLGDNFNLIEYENYLNFSPETNIPLGQLTQLSISTTAKIYLIFNFKTNVDVSFSLTYNDVSYGGINVTASDNLLTGLIYAEVPIPEITYSGLFLTATNTSLYGEIRNVKMLLSKDFSLTKGVFV